MASLAPDALSHRATEQVLDLVLRQGSPCVIVDSPPGAGKTHLVESVVAVAARLHMRIGVALPQNEQVFDLLRRLSRHFGPMGVQGLLSESRDLPSDVALRSELLPVVHHVHELHPNHRIIVGTVAKFFSSALALGRNALDLLVCDEAYQVGFKDFVPLSMIARQVLPVGDPGQLRPLITADSGRFEAAPVKVHWPVPQEIIRRFPDVPIVKLPVTRRLPQDTVDLIQPSHYPDLPFISAASPAERRISFEAVGLGDPIDQSLDMLAAGATVVALLLPALEYPVDDVDEEVAGLMARVVRRALDRGISMGAKRLRSSEIGCADAHVASNAAVGRHIRALGLSTEEVVSETPEQWQGLQRPIMVVKHPLSGKQQLDAFCLDPGRWCVMLSRHLGGCVIVGRQGIGDALRAHQHDCAGRPMQATDFEWIGWHAHSTLWNGLEARNRLF